MIDNKHDVTWYFRDRGERLLECVGMRTGPHDDPPPHDVAFAGLNTVEAMDDEGYPVVRPVPPPGYRYLAQ